MMEEKNTNNTNPTLDFDAMIKASKGIREAQAKTKKAPTSIKPLKFEKLEGDSALKNAIVDRMNSSHLTYSDLYNYCAKLMGGDISAGCKMGSNLINGLKNRHTMIDTTFSLLCDFLGYDVYLVPKKKEKSSKNEDKSNEESDGESTED